MATKSQQLLDYIREHESARTDEMGAHFELRTSTVSALLARYVLDGTLVTCQVVRPGSPPVNEYRFSVAGGGRTTEYRSFTPPQAGSGSAVHLKHNGNDIAAGASSVLEDKWLADPKATHAPSERARDEKANSQTTGLIGEIETHVPVPPRNGELRQALAVMKPGESRLLAGYTTSNIHNAARREKLTVAVRTDGDGLRVWRLK